MKIPLNYGLGIALAMSLLSLATHLADISTNPDKMFLAFAIGILGLLAIFITGIILATRAARAQSGTSGFSYGAAFKTGLLTTVVAGLGSAVFMFFYLKFIFPDFADVQIEATRNLMERMNAPASKVDEMLEEMRAKATVTRQLINGFMFHVVFGCIISLIVAAVVKRAPVEDMSEPPPIA